MGWDHYEYSLQCQCCGRVGKETRHENDWMESYTTFEGFNVRKVYDPRPSRQLDAPIEIPVCPFCGDGARVLHMPD